MVNLLPVEQHHLVLTMQANQLSQQYKISSHYNMQQGQAKAG
jgi:hypothetical protein